MYPGFQPRKNASQPTLHVQSVSPEERSLWVHVRKRSRFVDVHSIEKLFAEQLAPRCFESCESRVAYHFQEFSRTLFRLLNHMRWERLHLACFSSRPASGLGPDRFRSMFCTITCVCAIDCERWLAWAKVRALVFIFSYPIGYFFDDPRPEYPTNSPVVRVPEYPVPSLVWVCVSLCVWESVCELVWACVCVCVTMKKKCQTNGKHDKRYRRHFK